jgi:uncharacterized protein YxjI
VPDERFAHDAFFLDQLIRPIANLYRISTVGPDGASPGDPLAFVRQKKLKIREDIRFRLAPDAEDHVFMIRSKSVFEFRGRHEVADAEGSVIGMLEKAFGRSLLRSHWHVRDGSGAELVEAHEASWAIALVRRVVAVLPEWLAPLAWLPFNFVLRREGHDVGAYRRVLGKLRDRYVLEVTPDLAGVDRRLLVAFAVGLDALQDR